MKLSDHAELCGTCAYFRPDDRHADPLDPHTSGACWRYPPALGGPGCDTPSQVRRPGVEASSFCGEWKLRGETRHGVISPAHAEAISEVTDRLRKSAT